MFSPNFTKSGMDGGEGGCDLGGGEGQAMILTVSLKFPSSREIQDFFRISIILARPSMIDIILKQLPACIPAVGEKDL